MTCFGQFLCDHKMATFFARYMHSIYSEEELEFWLDVELFRLDSRRCKQQLAQEIYERYLTKDSLQQIHVDSDVLREVSVALTSTPNDTFDCKVFDRAQDAIEGVLVTDCLHRFKEILKTSGATFPQCPSALASKLYHYHKLSPVCRINKQRPQVSPSIWSSLLAIFHNNHSSSSLQSPPTSPPCSPPGSPHLSSRVSPAIPTANLHQQALPPLSLSPSSPSDTIFIPKSKSPNQLTVLIPSDRSPSSSPPSLSPSSPPNALPMAFTFTTQSQIAPISHRVSMHRIPTTDTQQHSPPHPLSPTSLPLPPQKEAEVIKGFSVKQKREKAGSQPDPPQPLSPVSPHSSSTSSLPFFPSLPSSQLEVLSCTVLAGHRSTPTTPVLESTKEKLVL